MTPPRIARTNTGRPASEEGQRGAERYLEYNHDMTRTTRDHGNFARKLSLAEDNDDGLVLEATPAERLQMVWPMTRDCWAFVPNVDAQLEFQRHADRVERRGR
jgi:hypothetical protein